MANYKKIYTDYFGYTMDPDEYIPSEISGSKAQDLHHIHPKQMGGKKRFEYKGITYDIDSVCNLIALTREQHTAAHDPTHKDHKTIDELWAIHEAKMSAYININKSRLF